MNKLPKPTRPAIKTPDHITFEVRQQYTIKETDEAKIRRVYESWAQESSEDMTFQEVLFGLHVFTQGGDLTDYVLEINNSIQILVNTNPTNTQEPS